MVANVTYANGREVARDIVKENITEESKPGKIAVGTLTQTDYIKPVAGTLFRVMELEKIQLITALTGRVVKA